MHILIIGGGISGLACAYRLRQLGASFLLLEQGNDVGGLMRSTRRDGLLLESGPQSFLLTEAIGQMVQELGIGDQLLRADAKAPRYVVIGGVLRKVPLSPPAMISSSFLGASTKLRMLVDLLGKSTPPENDESVAEFVRRKFGQDMLQRLVGPFVSGVYAGDPEKLSLRSAAPGVYGWEAEYGSVLRGAMKSHRKDGKPAASLCSFRDGVATLPRRLAESLGSAVATATTVESIVRHKANGSSNFEIHLQSRGRADLARADAVILATPPDVTARILGEVSPRYRGLLGSIGFAAIAVVSRVYLRSSVGMPLDGFGFLVPRGENIRVLGTIWNSSLFPGRAPEGQVLLTSFIGGATDPEILGYNDQAIESAVSTDLNKLLHISGEPLGGQLQRWTHALPQYNIGHGEILAATQTELAHTPGLFLAGNYFYGPSVGSCVDTAFRAAEEAHRFVAAMA